MITIVAQILILIVLYAFHLLIALTPVTFPSSVLCMLLLFLFLALGDVIWGAKFRSSLVVKYIEIGTAFGLKWISLFFVPAFVVLPLSEAVSGKEVGVIAGVFVVGWLAGIAGVVFVIWSLRLIVGQAGKLKKDNSSGRGEPDDIELLEIPESQASLNTVPLEEPTPTAEIFRPNNPGVSIPKAEQTEDPVFTSDEVTQQQPIEIPSKQRVIANYVSVNFDFIAYWVLFFVGMIVYFTTSYNMPVQIAIVVLAYKYCLLIPNKHKTYLHPILICAGFSILVIYILALIHRETIFESLRRFKTGQTYVYLFSAKYRGHLPGAGDVFSSLLDSSIVSLAMPMYHHKAELRTNFVFIFVPSILSALGSFFMYPPLCYVLGLSASRSLAFVARSATLALALPIVQALEGDQTLVAVVGILSGIVGVLVGGLILSKIFRVRKEDYVMRGTALGINSSAVASAHLLPTDPRAAAMGSLSFLVFGVLLVILAAIDPVVKLIHNWVGIKS